MTYRYKGFEADTVEEIIALRDALDVEPDWVEWNGGECPVDEYSAVEVKLRGCGAIECAAGNFRWEHDNGQEDIVAYRVINA